MTEQTDALRPLPGPSDPGAPVSALEKARMGIRRRDEVIDRLRRERDRLAEERDMLRQAQDRLLASGSWRLTAPLRWLRARVRG